jgi:hypothetical protein
MSSLRQLQEKISRLELDQNNVNNNNNNNNMDEPKVHIETKTNDTENRILKLEEQLDKMRRMVNENDNSANNRHDWANSNKRLENLEKDAALYETEQYFTDRNYQDLEHRLKKYPTKPRIQHEQNEIVSLC